ncbi:hypothetical protein VNO77_39126 [Canavalia gladiata]|uniref:Uncharacterized protein n=1 Tax=Canavalia gladiata TaxID=3824 RepID=A0AAN9KC46_CANGL
MVHPLPPSADDHVRSAREFQAPMGHSRSVRRVAALAGAIWFTPSSSPCVGVEGLLVFPSLPALPPLVIQLTRKPNPPSREQGSARSTCIYSLHWRPLPRIPYSEDTARSPPNAPTTLTCQSGSLGRIIPRLCHPLPHETWHGPPLNGSLS